MVMPMLTMHTLMGIFLFTGFAHADDFDLKAQRQDVAMKGLLLSLTISTFVS